MENVDDLSRPVIGLAEDRFLLDTLAGIWEGLERYLTELDAEYVVFRSHSPGTKYEDSVACLELIRDEVLPNS